MPDAPRTQAVIPGDAIRLGINIVSYVAALRDVAEAEAVTREIQAPTTRRGSSSSWRSCATRGTGTPIPNSIYQWLRHLANESSLAVGFELK